MAAHKSMSGDDSCCYLCTLFDEDEDVRQIAACVALPSDVWFAIAAHLSCVDARQTALVCRAAARGVERFMSSRRATVTRFDVECARLASVLRTCTEYSLELVYVDAITASAMVCTWLIDNVGARDSNDTAYLWLTSSGATPSSVGVRLYMSMRVTVKQPSRCIVWCLEWFARVNEVRKRLRTRDVWTMRRRVTDVVTRHLGTGIGKVQLFHTTTGVHHSFVSTVAPCMRAALLEGRRDAESMWRYNCEGTAR